jgi:hypothetical protein
MTGHGKLRQSLRRSFRSRRSPIFETMPWMNFDWETKRPRVDTLLPPSFVVPAIPKDSAFANTDVFNTRQLLAGPGVK